MATVKCPKCGKTFNREKENHIKIPQGSRFRYGHCSCYSEEEIEKLNAEIVSIPLPEKKQKSSFVQKEKSERTLLTDTINRIYHGKVNWPMVMKQVKNYIEKENMTERSIRLTLEWYYEICRNPLYYGKGGGIGIVPLQWYNAKQFYERKAKAQKQIEESKEDTTVIQIVKIKPPTKKPMMRLFDFEEGDNGSLL